MAFYSYNNFVRAIEPDSTSVEKAKNLTVIEPTDDGSEVKDFYESLVGLNEAGSNQESKNEEQKREESYVVSMSGSSGDCGKGGLSSTKRSESEMQYTPSECQRTLYSKQTASLKHFLQAAQDGDLKSLKDCIESGVDLNSQDHYGWTALMCAAQEGHVEVVKYLLWQECNMFIIDNKGVSAMDLAKKKRNKHIIRILTDHINGVTYKEKAQMEEGTSPKYPKFFCEVCKKHFEDCSQQSHETSTVHLFNMKLPTKTDGYLIPQSNKGFQMMLKSGWDQDKGLGNEGQGQKFPVKTLLKRDRKGLGLDEKVKEKARITHFQPNDSKAVKSVRLPSIRKEKASTHSKKAKAKKLSKEREFEKNYRMEFHMS